MAVRMVRLCWEIVIVHDLSAHEGLEWKSRQHVQPETETCDLDHGVRPRWEIVQNVAFGERAEGQESSQRHGQASNERDQGRIMSQCGEAVKGWRF